jgi:F-type H+-transporting ATPase subunit epsilon
MAEALTLSIVTPERTVVETSCDGVELPGEQGYFGVLPGHTPLIALLRIGEVSYRIGKIDHYLAVSSGFAEIGDNIVTVLVDTAEKPSEIDLAEAERDRGEAETEMKTASPDHMSVLAGRVDLATARIRVASRSR